METPVAVANYFIMKSLYEGRAVTGLQLLKLTYIAHGWHLALTQGAPLLSEGAEAWQYGPVIPSLYHILKGGGLGVVTRAQQTSESGPHPLIPQIQQQAIAPFLAKIWERYGHYDGLQLSALTHQENTPWAATWRKEGGGQLQGSVIPNQLLQAHYQALLAESTIKKGVHEKV